MTEFPYKNELINRWIYDKVPETMEMATSEEQIKIGTMILFKSTLSDTAGYFIATKVNATNFDIVIFNLPLEKVFIKKKCGI